MKESHLLQGSNGEVAYLSESERVSMVAAAREAVPKDSGKLIIAGTVGSRTGR